MGIDLESYRRVKGLSYRQLRAFIGSNHASRTRSWAIGEVWPDADVIQNIVQVTGAEVTLEAMHKRRLQWLQQHKPRVSAEQRDAAEVKRDEEHRCSEGALR